MESWCFCVKSLPLAFLAIGVLYTFVLSFLNCNDSSIRPKNAAAAFSRISAEVVSFQRMQPGHPPAQNVNSADCSLTAACHFGG
jgi:hypothetical protein